MLQILFIVTLFIVALVAVSLVIADNAGCAFLERGVRASRVLPGERRFVITRRATAVEQRVEGSLNFKEKQDG